MVPAPRNSYQAILSGGNAASIGNSKATATSSTATSAPASTGTTIRYLLIPADSSRPISEHRVQLDPAAGSAAKLSCDAAYFTPLLLKNGPPGLNSKNCGQISPFPTFNECQKKDVPLFFAKRLVSGERNTVHPGGGAENARAKQLLGLYQDKIGGAGGRLPTFFGDVVVFWRRSVDETRHQMRLADFTREDYMRLVDDSAPGEPPGSLQPPARASPRTAGSGAEKATVPPSQRSQRPAPGAANARHVAAESENVSTANGLALSESSSSQQQNKDSQTSDGIINEDVVWSDGRRNAAPRETQTPFDLVEPPNLFPVGPDPPPKVQPLSFLSSQPKNREQPKESVRWGLLDAVASGSSQQQQQQQQQGTESNRHPPGVPLLQPSFGREVVTPPTNDVSPTPVDHFLRAFGGGSRQDNGLFSDQDRLSSLGGPDGSNDAVVAAAFLKRFLGLMAQQLPLAIEAIDKIIPWSRCVGSANRSGSDEARIAELSALLVEAGLKDQRLSAALTKATGELEQLASYQSTLVRKQQATQQELFSAQAQAMALREDRTRLLHDISRLQEEVALLRGGEQAKDLEQRGGGHRTVVQASPTCLSQDQGVGEGAAGSIIGGTMNSPRTLALAGTRSALNGGQGNLVTQQRKVLHHVRSGSGLGASGSTTSGAVDTSSALPQQGTGAQKSAPRRCIVTQVYVSPSQDGKVMSREFASLNEGDIVTVEREDDSGWWWVSSGSAQGSGWYPLCCLKVITP